MKKLLSILTTVAVICCLLGVSAAADASAKVYVTVANGGLELANSEVTVTDIDGDGALTINDAFMPLTKATLRAEPQQAMPPKCPTTALCSPSFGESKTAAATATMSTTPLPGALPTRSEDGDYVNAFVYQDTKAFSDRYCYFDKAVADVNQRRKSRFCFERRLL